MRIAPLLQVPPASRGEPRTGSVPPARRGNLKEGVLVYPYFCELWLSDSYNGVRKHSFRPTLIVGAPPCAPTPLSRHAGEGLGVRAKKLTTPLSRHVGEGLEVRA